MGEGEVEDDIGRKGVMVMGLMWEIMLKYVMLREV